MQQYGVDLAKELKKRDNPSNIGAVLGKVVAVGADWRVSIKDGLFMIDKTNGYICNQILERKSKFDYKYSHSGSLSNGCTAGGSGGYSASGSGHGDIHLHEVWKVGDLVLVLPSASEQEFFIVDIVRR